MLAAGFLFTLATGPTAFGLTRTDVPPLTWTDPQLVRDAVAVPEGVNALRINTAPLAGAVRALPAVAAADVTVLLPDAALIVTIEERVPILAWQAGDVRYIADDAGIVFATVDPSAALPPGVAVIDDRRAVPGTSLAIGSQLDAVDLDVVTRLGSLKPADVGSAAASLDVRVTDNDGFVISAPTGWTAVFGFYSPATRGTAMIPGQVRLLKSLLGDREGAVLRVVLASETDGTYVPKPTPKASTR